MENHPIPQDITGFQFKLIGNMTVKQFAYLAGGVILAWVCYILPITGFIKFPFAFVFAIIGVAFAFLPIEGRPLDVMITHFIKALLSPTQFIYQKSGRPIYFPMPAIVAQSSAVQARSDSGLSGKNLKAFLDSLPKRPKNKLDEKEMVFFQSLGNIATPQSVTQPTPAFVPPHAMDTVAVQPKQVDLSPTENEPQTEELELEREAKALQEQLSKAKQQEQAQAGTTNQEEAHKKVLELEQILQETVGQKQELEKQLLALNKTLQAQQQKQVYKPSLAVAEKEETKNVRSIPKGMGRAIGLPNASEFPNIVSGIVKDPRGNSLSNILVEIKDSENNPVRAFKTNALGQFASATPLTNGTYTIEFEDPKTENKFDIIQFSASGEVILPIEVISVDTREELRRSLFN